MKVDKEFENRMKGCMWGLAAGDALGAGGEFKARDHYKLGGYVRGELGLTPGSWTDDTSMALALADSLSRGWDPSDQLNEYVKWLTEGKYGVNGRCVDIGGTTHSALSKWRQGKWLPLDCGGYTESTQANGSIMRLAPVVIWSIAQGHPLEDLLDYCADSSRTTHRHRMCIDTCKYLGLILAELISGQSISWIVDPTNPMFIRLTENFSQPLKDIQQGDWRNKERHEINSSGYVVTTLEAALWCVYKTNSFEEAVLLAANLGSDADTVGAVTGQIAGAYYGYDHIASVPWLLEGLLSKEMIEEAYQKIV